MTKIQKYVAREWIVFVKDGIEFVKDEIDDWYLRERKIKFSFWNNKSLVVTVRNEFLLRYCLFQYDSV